MDKNILKKFAIESRQELMEKVSNKIKKFYIDEEFKVKQSGEVYVLVNDKHCLSLTNTKYKNRELLIKRIKEITLEQVIEEAAYTWFNRMIAIRYMELRDYLPLTKDNHSLGIRVLSSKENTPDPEIMKISNLMNPDLDINFDKEYYANIQDSNKRFEYLLLLVCNKLGKVIPQVFAGTTDYINILIPDNLLNDSGYITKLLREVPADNFDEVEIIGWLYQYYISEKKDTIFEKIKNNTKISKENIPAATQLFTPEWIVKYLVDNSLGRYLNKKEKLSYFVDCNEKTTETKKVEDITFLDPCCGSGHILVYALEVLYEIYMQNGYTKENAIKLILKNNLYGIDLDERAIQLTILSLCLKAREYDENFFAQDIINDLNILSISDSNLINREIIGYDIKHNEDKETLDYILNVFHDASEFGSLIKCENRDYDQFYTNLTNINQQDFIGLQELNKMIQQAKILAKKYTVVCTNPPYMGRKSMNDRLGEFLAKHYPNNKSEMYTAFIERCNDFTELEGYQAMITIHTWMFISSYEETRKLILDNNTIINMLHTGPATFTELSSFNVLSTAFCIKKAKEDIKSTFIRLVDYYNPEEKVKNFNNHNHYYSIEQKVLYEIPGAPFIYWISNDLRDAFKENETLANYYSPKQGLATADNDKFLRLWFEVEKQTIKFDCNDCKETVDNKIKWYPYNKGGNYRKWYGNNEWVVNWENDGREIRNFTDGTEKIKSRPQNTQYYFKEGITWSLFGFENFGVRYKENGFIFDVSGSSMFPRKEDLYYVIGYLCSNVAFKFLSLLAPTVNFQVGNIASLPYKDWADKSEINELVQENIAICKEDWDSKETSWNFLRNPLLQNEENNLKASYQHYANCYNDKRDKLRKNEEKLNQIYSTIFNTKEIDCSVNDRDLTLKELDKVEVIKSFISYAVGCMFGRYSLEKDGLIFAGGKLEPKCISGLCNIIPITEDYFGDDMTTRFRKFIEMVYGKETLYENFEFIAEILGKRNGENSEDTIRRYFINDFYNDHLKVYQKRPIYWLFDSGKKNGFKCLIYMHRYNEGTVSKIRLDYLHRMQNIYEKQLNEIKGKLDTECSLSEKRELTKKQVDISSKLQETNEYDEKIAHIADQRIKIDLDEGVVVNYAKFKVVNPKTGKEESILGKIK